MGESCGAPGTCVLRLCKNGGPFLGVLPKERIRLAGVPRSPKEGMAKQYDMFISYARADRRLVHSFARRLTERGLLVWIDAWEMSPGDVLRDRITAGIQEARYFLIVLSPTSLESDWVKYELTSGLLLEVEAGRVRVIPAIAKGADFADLPIDLRTKFCLDLRNTQSRRRAVDQLVDLVRPEARERRELLAALRKPSIDDPRIVPWLGEHANRGRDQAIQVAALRGLQSVGGASAVDSVAERAVDTWGMRGIAVAIDVLARLATDGGLLALAMILCTDGRFYDSKLAAIHGVLKHRGVRPPNEASARRRLVADFEWLLDQDDLDVRHGAPLALTYDRLSPLLDRPPPPTLSARRSALEHAAARVPGLVETIELGLARSEPIPPDAGDEIRALPM